MEDIYLIGSLVLVCSTSLFGFWAIYKEYKRDIDSLDLHDNDTETDLM
jgi:hypothetical protein